MELHMTIETQDSKENNIYKMSYKQLRELAIQKNINHKLKKAQLVSALLSTGEAANCDKIEHTNHRPIRRVTRANANILKYVDNTHTNIEKNSIIGVPQTSSEKECKTKTRGKKSKCESREESHKAKICVNALSEITNTEELLENIREINLSMNNETKITGKEIVSMEQVTNLRSSENDSANFNHEIVSKRQGRKKKNVQESNNCISSDVTINSSEDQSNAEERTAKLEDVTEQKKPKRGRKGKIGNVSDPVLKNDPCIYTLPSHKLLSENSFSGSQENVRENISFKNNMCPIPDSNCVISSCSEIVQSPHLELIEDGMDISKQQLLKEESSSSNKIENMPVPVAIVRSSTFVLENKDENSIESLRRRDTTFTISDEDCKTNATPDINVNKLTKSIGSRILSSSKKLSTIKSVRKQPVQGPSVQKTISKRTATPGSAYKNKFGFTKKAPNFKAIHQKLFENMESLPDNLNRNLKKAKSLIQTPVPRCAMSLSSPKWELKKKNEIKIKPGMPKIQKQTPVRNSPLAGASKTPLVNNISSPVPTYASINRFGFNKKHINKDVASSVVGTKLPPVNLDKRKDENRALIHGVRMNKRFMLQMKMRQNKE